MRQLKLSLQPFLRQEILICQEIIMDGHPEKLRGTKTSSVASLLIALHSVTNMVEQTSTVPLDNFSQFSGRMDNGKSRDSKTTNSSTVGRIKTSSHSSTLSPEETFAILCTSQRYNRTKQEWSDRTSGSSEPQDYPLDLRKQSSSQRSIPPSQSEGLPPTSLPPTAPKSSDHLSSTCLPLLQTGYYGQHHSPDSILLDHPIDLSTQSSSRRLIPLSRSEELLPTALPPDTPNSSNRFPSTSLPLLHPGSYKPHLPGNLSLTNSFPIHSLNSSTTSSVPINTISPQTNLYPSSLNQPNQQNFESLHQEPSLKRSHIEVSDSNVLWHLDYLLFRTTRNVHRRLFGFKPR